MVKYRRNWEKKKEGKTAWKENLPTHSPITWLPHSLAFHQPSNVNYTSAPLTAGPMLPHWEERWYPELNLEEIFRMRWGTLPFFCLSFKFVHFCFSDRPHFIDRKYPDFVPPPPHPLTYIIMMLGNPFPTYTFSCIPFAVPILGLWFPLLINAFWVISDGIPLSRTMIILRSARE